MVPRRGPAGARLRSARLLDDFFVSGPLQQATLELVTAPAPHLRLTYAAAPPELMDEAVRRLARAVRSGRDGDPAGP